MGQRRTFTREFKLEAVKLVKERGVSVAQASRDLELHENILRKWIRQQATDPQHAFPGHGQMKPEQQEIERLRREGGRFLSEQDAVVPEDHPAAVRATATASATSTANLHGIELRLASFVHGHGGSVLVPILVDAARKTGRSIYVGTGSNRLSAAHVNAIAEAYVAAIDRGRPGAVYHLAADDAPTMRDLAEAIAIGTGTRAESVTAEEATAQLGPFVTMFLSLDNGLSSLRARKELGWLPAGWPSLLWDVAHGSHRLSP